jgi:hypothetical protein
MNYRQWNNAISSFFFNESKAGKEVLLFFTRQDVSDIGKENGIEGDEVGIFNDFIEAIKYPNLKDSSNFDESSTTDLFELKIPSCPIEYPLYLYNEWEKKDKSKELYPPYIAYLALYILPLTEIVSEVYNNNNYYDRVNDLFKEYGIQKGFKAKKIGSLNFCYLAPLWSSLEYWSIIVKDTMLGAFVLSSYIKKKRKYVQVPFSQCIFPPKAILRMPQLFLEADWLPDSYYPESEYKKVIIQFGNSILGLSKGTLDVVQKSSTNDLGHSIIEIAKREYTKWSGESHEIIENDTKIRAKRNYIPSRLFLQFKININDESILFSYRLYSSNDYPEDLKFDDYSGLYEFKGWSKTIPYSFCPEFELKDENNKWIAKFPKRNIRLFISAATLQLSSDFWIETDILIKSSWMYLLCSNELSQSIIKWGEENCHSFIDQSYYLNVPENYSLFKIQGPKSSHPDISLLSLSSEKSFHLINGLKINFRSYLFCCLPEIVILNSTGDEQISLSYKDNSPTVILIKKQGSENIWLLPPDIQINSPFYIHVENENLDGYRFAYTIEKPDYSLLSNNTLIKRNIFSKVPSDTESYIQGNNIKVTENLNTVVNQQLFLGYSNNYIHFDNIKYSFYNILLDWLVAVKKCNIQTFNETFESIYVRVIGRDTNNIQRYRKSSINLYDYLGFIDYSYDENLIVTLPPKLIRIPSEKGKKALLIGGRDINLMDKLYLFCLENKDSISISIKKHNEINTPLLLPETIILESNSTAIYSSLAEYLKIDYDEMFILKLQSLTPNITDYENYIITNCISESQEDYQWARKVFDKKTLKFNTVSELSKEYTLAEYTLSQNWKKYGLWIDGKYYSVDKNWGRYLVINHYSPKEFGYRRDVHCSRPQLIFYDNNKLAVPTSIHLPKLILRAFLSFSGIAPEIKKMNLNGEDRWYNIYSNVPSAFIYNFFKFKLNMNIESTNKPF